MKLKQHFLEFIGCHGGTVNRILHMIGFILIFVGIIIKNVYIVLVGAVVQEIGHFYQYSKTKEKMKEVLKDIQSGKFAKQWMDECKGGQKNFLKMRADLSNHPIEKIGKIKNVKTDQNNYCRREKRFL